MSFITRAALHHGRDAQRSLVSLLLDASRGDAAHRLVWSLFSEAEARRDFLYREVEPGRFLIVSARAPVDAAGLWRLESKPYAPQFKAGQRLAFSLRANPVVRTRSARDASGRGRRADAVMHAKTTARAEGRILEREAQADAALAWLSARAGRIGVRLDQPRCAVMGYEARRIRRGEKPDATFQVVDYEGALQVDDPDALWRTMREGLGAAKA